MKQKLLYILPHCSTGGMPAYVLRQLRDYKKDYHIMVVEMNNHGDDFIVHRNEIAAICQLVQVNGSQGDLLQTVDRFAPNIICFQEIPETFLNHVTCVALFGGPRPYYILIQAHSTAADFAGMKYLPDRFVAVNNWQLQQYKAVHPDADATVWEYPIDLQPFEPGLARKLARGKLNIPSCQKMVLNVGLFTPGKNQAELIRLARVWKHFDFHFVGNQADNFREYWEPLVKNLPPNCHLHGERPDTHLFYQAADLFYFTSNYELNPIVVKEALSYHLPILMKKLPSYGSDYDNNPLVTFLQ